ncbi:MAG: sigma-54-dependent Fis family transcriptional regulator [Afipia sp. 64-13]|nr:MAG: sigma-54-dependent Fis family transcriptional regulator [Afipia sp. 64-13]
MPFPTWQNSTADEARFLRTVLDHVSDCLVAVDTEGRVVLINRPYCKLLGGEEEDFIGRKITDVVSHETRLHLVARGESAVVGFPLNVRGHRLITKQVPVLQDGEIVGALGLALFSDFEALRRTYSKLSNNELAINNAKTPWIARHSIDDIIGRGVIMDKMREDIRAAAATALPVLIEGETGTGKELAAQAIHRLSDRARGPFVWMNCASIPQELIEAELFGYEGGAFTGARSRGKPGKFELAKGGTLFLDEIGDMPLSLQSNLLRALQGNEIVRVGGLSPIQIDTRIICATNRSLQSMVADRQFRKDLFYRLDVLRITTPPLRKRADKAELIERILPRLAASSGLSLRKLPPSKMKMLLAHDWPGNVRELESALSRFLVDGSIDFATRDIKDELSENAGSQTAKLKNRLRSEKSQAIQEALVKAGFDKALAATMLGISRAQLYRELTRHDIFTGDTTSKRTQRIKKSG